MTEQDPIAEIWKLFKETDTKFKETQAELDRRFAETDARLDQRIAQTDARLAQQFTETDSKITRLEGILGMQWGKFIEALIHPAALHLFQERGIQVHHIYQRAKSHINGDTLEIDLLLENGNEVVLVEVKSTLRVSDVQDFLLDLGQFLGFFPRYQGYKIYGAVAGLEVVEDAGRYAYKQGLFVLGVEGDGVVQMKNDVQFRPKDFGQ